MPPRLDAKAVFLTFPQNDTSPETALQAIIDREGERLKWAVVARELHLDGHPHLHVLVTFSSRIRCKLDHFDYVGGNKHGNYQSARYPKKCLAYVVKKGEFVAFGIEPLEYLKEDHSAKKGKKMTDELAKAIQDGATDAALLAMSPGFVMLHLRQIDAFRTRLSLLSKTTRTDTATTVTLSLTSPTVSPVTWSMNRTSSQKFRNPALWLCGPTKTGKTTVLDELFRSLAGFQIPFNNDFSLWLDHAYDFAYCDEFHGQLTVAFLNAWIQGHPMHLNTKGSSVMKNHNLPTIIVSNFTPQQCFPKAQQLETLLGRLVILEVSANEFASDLLKIVVEPTASEEAETQDNPREEENSQIL